MTKYYVEIDDRTFEVEIDAQGVRLDGDAVSADLESKDDAPLWHLVVDGRAHTLRARKSDGRGAWSIEIDGRRHDVLALDERGRAIRNLTRSRADSRAPIELKAPMPGLIISVGVEPEDVVQEGQGLVVMEAMKMENELKAAATGRVREVRVASGDAVDKGDTLLVIEPKSDGGPDG